MEPVPVDPLRDVLEREADVHVAALFGSAATGHLAPGSDVDIYVRLRPGASWSPAHAAAVVGALEHITRREVDLVVEDRDSTSTLLRLEVARHGRLIFERRQGAWITLRAEAMVDHADLEPFMQRCGAGVRRRLRARAHG
jgi:predicted nucleotidyltransferase